MTIADSEESVDNTNSIQNKLNPKFCTVLTYTKGLLPMKISILSHIVASINVPKLYHFARSNSKQNKTEQITDRIKNQ